MALSKQVDRVAVQLAERSESGWDDIGDPILVDLWSMTAFFFAEAQNRSRSITSLTGQSRRNPSGYRANISTTLVSVSPSSALVLKTLLNDVFASPTGYARAVRIAPDELIGKGVYCTIRSAEFGIRRRGATGRQYVDIRLVGAERLPEVPSAWQILEGEFLILQSTAFLLKQDTGRFKLQSSD